MEETEEIKENEVKRKLKKVEMKTRRMFLFAMCGMAMLIGTSSCKKDEKENIGEEMRIEAALKDANGNAKTYLDGKKVVWNNGDAFMLFREEGTTGHNFQFQQITGDEGRKAAFVGTKPGNAPYYAGYPSADLSCSQAGVFNFNIPQLQSENTNAGPMVGCMGVNDNLLTFRNAMSWLKVGLKGSNDVAITRITLKDNNEDLYGTLTVSCSGNESSNFSFSTTMTNGGDELENIPNPAAQLDPDEFTYFWFLVPANSLKSLKLTAYTGVNGNVKVLELNETISHENVPGINGNTILTANVVNPSVDIIKADVVTKIGCTTDHIYEFGVSVTGHDANNTTYKVGVCYNQTSDENPADDPTMGNCDGYKEIEVPFTIADGAIQDITYDFTNLDLVVGAKYKIRAYAMNGVYAYGNVKQITGGDVPQPLPDNWTDSHSPYKFTVKSNGDKIYFSRGNLQYNADGASESANYNESVGGTWRFAEHQYDFIGKANENIAYSYKGWIDLLAWGTSSWRHNTNSYQSSYTCYLPWCVDQKTDHYIAYGNSNYNLYDQTGMADWGYNTIYSGNTQTTGWRSLTGPEWDWLIGPHYGANPGTNCRANATDLWGLGKVGSCTPGLIILPDNWVLPTGATFTKGYSDGFNTNSYSFSEWAIMEGAGAVFLPAAGYRKNGTEVNCTDMLGYYWTSSRTSSNFNNFLYIQGAGQENGAYTRTSDYQFGYCVRLVKNATN